MSSNEEELEQKHQLMNKVLNSFLPELPLELRVTKKDAALLKFRDEMQGRMEETFPTQKKIFRTPENSKKHFFLADFFKVRNDSQPNNSLTKFINVQELCKKKHQIYLQGRERKKKANKAKETKPPAEVAPKKKRSVVEVSRPTKIKPHDVSSSSEEEYDFSKSKKRSKMQVQDSSSSSSDEGGMDVDDPDVYEVEALVDKKVHADGEIKYLVKWKGYEEQTWEPPENISCDLIEEYESEARSEYVLDQILDRRRVKKKTKSAIKEYEYYVKWVGFKDKTWEPAENIPRNLRRTFDKKYNKMKSKH